MQLHIAPQRCGQVAEWLKAADCKSARFSARWFESSPETVKLAFASPGNRRRRGESYWQTANAVARPCAQYDGWRNCLSLVAGDWRYHRRPCAYLAALTGGLHLARAAGAMLDRAHIRSPI